MPTIIERNFSGGEIAPSLYSRCDTTKYATGLRTMRNFLTLRQGGAANRPGTSFLRNAVDSTHKVRFIPFVFSNDQALVLEIGHNYINPIFNYTAADDTILVSAITKANPAVVTCTTAPANGVFVYFDTVVGMRQINRKYFKVANRTSTTFQLQTVAGVNIDSTAYDSFVSANCHVAQILTTTYSEIEIFDLRFVQSADVVTIVHPNHPPALLTRSLGGTFGTWAINNMSFNPSNAAPSSGITSSLPTGTDLYYVVTTNDPSTGEESLGSTPYGVGTSTSGSLTALATGVFAGSAGKLGITPYNAYHGSQIVITTASGHDYSSATFTITGLDANGTPLVVGIAGPNGNSGINSVSTSVYFASVTNISVNIGIASPGVDIGIGNSVNKYPNQFIWNAVAGDNDYNVYKGTAAAGPFGYVGTVTSIGFGFTGAFTDNNVVPDYTRCPPDSTSYFNASGDYPSCCTYYQQRLVFSNSNNEPETVWTSKNGNFKNFTKSSPIQSDDSIKFNIAGRQVNSVRHMADLGTLILFTQSGEFAALGDSSGTLTPTAINAKQQSYNGSNNLAPIVIDGSALYVQARNSIVRDLNFLFQVNGYRGDDLTIFSAHLFDGYSLNDWAYQKVPHSIAWAVRSDGTLLGLTYIKDQQILGWHRHDFEGGLVESVAAIPGTGEDFLYLIINRSGVRSLEVMSTRLITDITQANFLDASVSYDGTNTQNITMTLSGGTTWKNDELLTLTGNSGSPFTSSSVGSQIWLTGSDGTIIRFTINAYSSATVVSGFPNKTVPASMQGIAIAASSWAYATKTFTGLDHLEGKNVSVFADGFVVSSVHNSDYSAITVTNGSVTLPVCHSKVRIGLPITADIETLDVDLPNAETLTNKTKLITRVGVRVQDTRGLFVGRGAPTGTDYIEDLMELKIRYNEDYDSPVNLATDVVSVNIQPDWNSNGRIFLRQVDPLPATICSISASGIFLQDGVNQ